MTTSEGVKGRVERRPRWHCSEIHTGGAVYRLVRDRNNWYQLFLRRETERRPETRDA